MMRRVGLKELATPRRYLIRFARLDALNDKGKRRGDALRKHSQLTKVRLATARVLGRFMLQRPTRHQRLHRRRRLANTHRGMQTIERPLVRRRNTHRGLERLEQVSFPKEQLAKTT